MRWILAMATLPIGLFVSACCQNPPTTYALPTSEEIESIWVIGLYDGLGHRSGPFDVPQERSNTLLVSLSPSLLDAKPCKWEIMCEMEVQTKSDRRLRIDLYKTPAASESAFSVAPLPFDAATRPTYYRGGRQAQVVTELQLLWREANKGQNRTASFDPELLGNTESDVSERIESTIPRQPLQ